MFAADVARITLPHPKPSKSKGLTQIQILKSDYEQALKPQAREIYYYDIDLPGFGARLNPSGTIAFFVQYRPNNSRQSKRYNIGRYGMVTPENARLRAKQVMAGVTFDEDPAQEKRIRLAEGSFDDAAQRFLDYFEKEVAVGNRKRTTLVSYLSLYKGHVKPFLGSRKLSEIKKQDIAALKHELSDIKYQANRCITFISGVYSWLDQNELLPDSVKNPCSHVKKNIERPRERYLTSEEANTLLQLLDTSQTRQKFMPAILNMIKLLLFTGARLGEISNLKWSEVDLEAKVLLLADSKTGAKTIFLSDEAIAVIQSIQRLRNHAYVMAGAKPRQPIKDIQNAWQIIRKQSGLDGLRLHDLRHTYASFAAKAGHSLPVIGALLGHRNQATTKRYVHLASSHLLEAANTTGKLFERKTGA